MMNVGIDEECIKDDQDITFTDGEESWGCRGGGEESSNEGNNIHEPFNRRKKAWNWAQMEEEGEMMRGMKGSCLPIYIYSLSSDMHFESQTSRGRPAIPQTPYTHTSTNICNI